jgi:hypothetical protein
MLCHYYSQNMARLDAWIRDYLSHQQATGRVTERPAVGGLA